jgi:hypothetical protein
LTARRVPAGLREPGVTLCDVRHSSYKVSRRQSIRPGGGLEQHTGPPHADHPTTRPPDRQDPGQAHRGRGGATDRPADDLLPRERRTSSDTSRRERPELTGGRVSDTASFTWPPLPGGHQKGERCGRRGLLDGRRRSLDRCTARAFRPRHHGRSGCGDLRPPVGQLVLGCLQFLQQGQPNRLHLRPRGGEAGTVGECGCPLEARDERRPEPQRHAYT